MDNVVMEKKFNLEKSSWESVKLGSLLKDVSVRVDNPANSSHNRFVGLEHFVSGDIKIRNWGSTDNLVSSAKAFKAGDILFARRNAYLRRASLVDFAGCCSGDAFVLRQSSDKVIPGYLAFLMNSNSLWQYANSNAAGTMSKRVKWRDLAQYQFLLPPKEEQFKLAELLWAMDEVIESDQNLLLKLNIQRKVQEKEDFGHDLNAKLQEIVARTLSGGTPDTKKAQYYTNGTIPWVTTKILDGDRIREGEKLITEKAVKESAAKILSKGNVIAGTRVGVGKFSINDVDMSFSQDVTGLKINKEKVDVEFLVHQLNSIVFQARITPLLRGTTIKGITKDDLLALKIHLPHKKEQQRVSEKFRILKDSIKEVTSKVEISKFLQKKIINQIF